MSNLPITNAAPNAADYGVIVRPVGAGAGGATTVVDPVYTPSAPTVVAYSAVDVELVAANANRFKYRIQNLTDRYLYIREDGVAATATNCHIALAPNAVYESQCRTVLALHGIGAAGGAGNVMVTEFTI